MQNICHKCGQKIFNGIPSEVDMIEYVAMMKEKGFKIGYDTETVGFYGNMHEVLIKPICGDCKNEEHRIEKAKELKKVMRKIIPMLKKVYVCPICQQDVRQYDNKIFTTVNKNEIINHIEMTHKLSDIKYLIPAEEY